MFRPHTSRLVLALLGALSLLPLPVLAQAAPSAASAKPASMELMGDLALTSAVSTCELAVEAKLPVEKSIISHAKAITYLVTNRYGSQVGSSSKLQPDQIANGSIIQTVARVKQGCYAKLNATDKKFIDTVIADFEKQVKASKGGKP